MPARSTWLGSVAFCLVASAGASAKAAPDQPDITVEADVRDPAYGRIAVRETIAVTPGAVTLRYPQWIPGHHAPKGNIAAIAGLTIGAGNRAIAWRRDARDPFTFHIVVPPGVTRITVAFDRLGALDRSQGQIFASPNLVRLDWDMLLLYPAGRPVAQQRAIATIRTPPGWQVASALDRIDNGDGAVRFAPASLETLIDSPAYAARHLARYAIRAGAKPPVTLVVAADEAVGTAVTPAQVAALGKAFAQVARLFGSEPYHRYEFLTTQSVRLTGQGIEHRRSTEASLPPRYFADPEGSYTLRHLLVHEYIHAWNGKLHRPAGLVVPDYNTPMQGDLLWVYEGLTTYLDKILTVRGGLWTAQDGRDLIAASRAHYDVQAGRRWRSLQDTTVQPVIGDAPAWQDWARGSHYYDDGALLWLDIDLRLRALTKGRRSLDDFARAFFGRGDADMPVLPYGFDDVAAALNAVAPSDWAAFLRRRLDATGDDAATDALADSGYRLVYTDRPSAWHERVERRADAVALDHSWGMTVGLDGVVRDVAWGGPAFAAGVLPGDTIRTIDARPFTAQALRDAVAASRDAERTNMLAIDGRNGPRTARIVYRGGLRYPHLEPVAGNAPRALDAILAAR